jgi:hypothetical protein
MSKVPSDRDGNGGNVAWSNQAWSAPLHIDARTIIRVFPLQRIHHKVALSAPLWAPASSNPHVLTTSAAGKRMVPRRSLRPLGDIRRVRMLRGSPFHQHKRDARVVRRTTNSTRRVVESHDKSAEGHSLVVWNLNCLCVLTTRQWAGLIFTVERIPVRSGRPPWLGDNSPKAGTDRDGRGRSRPRPRSRGPPICHVRSQSPDSRTVRRPVFLERRRPFVRYTGRLTQHAYSAKPAVTNRDSTAFGAAGSSLARSPGVGSALPGNAFTTNVRQPCNQRIDDFLHSGLSRPERIRRGRHRPPDPRFRLIPSPSAAVSGDTGTVEVSTFGCRTVAVQIHRE